MSNYQKGKSLRGNIPRESHAAWSPGPKRPDVLQFILQSDEDRLEDLIPIRHFRMSESAFAFYRATASIMAYDLSSTPVSGINVQACGDCHMMNFGAYATPERNIVFDINDFDETLPAPWEWDIKRLAVSFVLAARELNLNEAAARDMAYSMAVAYKNGLNEFSQMSLLHLWYLRFDISKLEEEAASGKVRDFFSRALKKAKEETNDRAFLDVERGRKGTMVIREKPPLVVHPSKAYESEELQNIFNQEYQSTLLDDRRYLFEQFTLADMALKVVGVGSVGRRCYIGLFLNEKKEPLFLQVKEALDSVFEPYLAKSQYTHHGQRVVQGQRLIQSAVDIFIGWTTGTDGRQYYIRQLRDKKYTPKITQYDADLLKAYAKLCGRTLARAHAKTSQQEMICGYIGRRNIFESAVSKFAVAYADQTLRDYENFMKAIKAGKLKTAEG